MSRGPEVSQRRLRERLDTGLANNMDNSEVIHVVHVKGEISGTSGVY